MSRPLKGPKGEYQHNEQNRDILGIERLKNAPITPHVVDRLPAHAPPLPVRRYRDKALKPLLKKKWALGARDTDQPLKGDIFREFALLSDDSQLTSHRKKEEIRGNRSIERRYQRERHRWPYGRGILKRG